MTLIMRSIRNLIRKFILLALFALSTNFASADDRIEYLVKNPKCTVMTLKGRKWIKAKVKLSKDDPIRGIRSKKKRGHLLFKRGKRSYQISTSCLKRKPEPKPDPLPENELSTLFGFSFWQEVISLNGSTYSVTHGANQLSFNAGVQYQIFFAQQLAVGAQAGLLAGKCQLGPNTSAEPDATEVHSDAGATIFGVRGGIGLTYYPSEISEAGVGLLVPLIYRSIDWNPPPGADQTLEGKSRFINGFVLQAIMKRESFHITPEVGFLENFSTVYFGLMANYLF